MSLSGGRGGGRGEGVKEEGGSGRSPDCKRRSGNAPCA